MYFTCRPDCLAIKESQPILDHISIVTRDPALHKVSLINHLVTKKAKCRGEQMWYVIHATPEFTLDSPMQ